MSKVIRYGVLGASRIARNKHIPAFGSVETASLAAVASRDASKAAAWAAEFGVPRHYGSYEALLADEAIDAVIITLPNALHAAWAVKAAEAGKHILCEKPLATSAADATAMFDAAAAAEVVLMEGFWTRFHPHLAFLRETLDSGEIGEVRFVDAALTYTLGDWEGDSRARADLGGGALLDAGCYCCNIIRWILGAEPTSATGWRREHPVRRVDADFAGLLAFDGGRVGMLTASMAAPFRVCCEVTATAGRIYVDTLFADSTVTVESGGTTRTHTFAAGGFAAQLEHFTACVIGGGVPRVTPAESIGNAATLEALAESARTGRAVAISR